MNKKISKDYYLFYYIYFIHFTIYAKHDSIKTTLFFEYNLLLESLK